MHIFFYHPSGTSGDERQAFKMIWLDRFLDYVQNLRKERPNMLYGDYNIAQKHRIYTDPQLAMLTVRILLEERSEWLTKFLDHKYIDSFTFQQRPAQLYMVEFCASMPEPTKDGELII